MSDTSQNQNAKKKILFVITKSNYGGAQRYVYDLATNLPKDRFNVSVACGGDGLLVSKLQDVGITVHRIQSFDRDINVKKEFSAFRELKHIMQQERPDVVHLNSSKAGGLGAFVARLVGVPKIVFTAHGWPFFENRSLLWKLMAWAGSWATTLLAHHTIVVSQYDRTHAHMYGLMRKIVHIPLGIAPPKLLHKHEARTALFPADVITCHLDDLWLVSIAEHTKNKNLLAAIQAVEKHNAQNTRKILYALMGAGELTASYKSYVRERGLEDQIIFLGYVDDASQYLKAFDVFILPSLKEGFPYVLLEAGHAGILVIASPVGGIPELIEDTKTGLLIDNSIEGVLSHVVQDPKGSETLASELHEKVNTHSLTTLIENTRARYES